MSRWIGLRLVSVSLVLACLSVPSAVDGAEPAANLSEILGAGADDWNITPEAYVLSGEPGRPAMSAPAGQTLVLETKGVQAAPSECLVTYRLKPPAGAWASVYLQMACAEKADKTPQALAFSVSACGGQKCLNYSASVQGWQASQPPPGVLHLEAVSERSLAWSEEMRKTIEVQIAAAPKLEETIFTLRCTVEKGRFRCYLNGRFVSETALETDMDPAGVVRLQVGPNAELVSLRVRPLAPVRGGFEPLSIAGHLNAATIAGKKVDRASLPLPETVTAVDDVPFLFPASAANGEDHIDVGTSWTRFGALSGYFDAQSMGAFGGRWTSADRTDPARICMHVPQGRYKALHLIAAADGQKDSVPIVTAQFYRPEAGHPINFAGTVPTLEGVDAGKAQPVPVKLADGKNANFYHVVIPLDPDAFSWFTDLDRIGLELTKQVQFYRGYPDPLEYSWHGAGLPSSVHIYAATLERAGVEVDIQADQFGHVWTAPAAPKYTIQLKNGTGKATTAKLVIDTKSQDSQNPSRQEQKVELTTGDTAVSVPITLKPTRFGLHELTVSLAAGGEPTTYHQNFAYLHEDTREHETWESGRGSIFGFWDWGV